MCIPGFNVHRFCNPLNGRTREAIERIRAHTPPWDSFSAKEKVLALDCSEGKRTLA